MSRKQQYGRKQLQARLNTFQAGLFIGREEKIACICSMKHISIHIDRLTNSIINVVSGDVFDTEFHALRAKDKPLLKKGWSFDWLAEMRSFEVFKLVIAKNPSVIQGLISLTDKGDHIFVNVVENAYFNIGKNKVYEGVGGNLFAFACKLSHDKGYEGFVTFFAKTQLLGHYERTLGAKRVGQSTRMIIEPKAAERLIKQYFGKK